MITMYDILNIACEVVKVDISQVLVPCTAPKAKQRLVVFARHLSMTLAHEHNMGTLDKIGKFHLRSHCDVIHAIKTVKNDVTTNKLRREIKDIANEKTNDSIKRFGWMPDPDYLDDLLDGE